MRSLFPLLLLFTLPAWAKSPSKMTDQELLAALKDGEKAADRAEAALEIGERRLQDKAPDLGATCGGDPDPAVCDAALTALTTLNADGAWVEVQAVLERASAPAPARQRALSILLEEAPALFDSSAPRVLSVYRSLDPALAVDLFQAIGKRDLTRLQDGVMFAVLDGKLSRDARLAALSAAEQFGHVRLYEGYIAFLKDHDRELRVRCAEGLNDPALPGSVVVPALIDAANNDAEGSVRAAAMIALRQYAHTELLEQVIHPRLMEDSQPYAWESAFELLVILGDQSSLKTLYKVLDEKQYLKEDYLFRIVDLIASMDNLESIPSLQLLEQRHQGTKLAQHCRDAVELIEDEVEKPPRPQPPVDFNVWVPDQPDPDVPPLAVSMGSNNVLSGL